MFGGILAGSAGSSQQPGSEASGLQSASSNASDQKSHKGWVWKEFTPAPKPGDAAWGKCKHCPASLSTKNATRMKMHLLNPRECGFLQSDAARRHKDTEVRAGLHLLQLACAQQGD
jgi:hypothetical protein